MDLVFYHVLIVSVILSNQAFTGNIVEKPASQKTEQATSQVHVCVSLYDAFLWPHDVIFSYVLSIVQLSNAEFQF